MYDEAHNIAQEAMGREKNRMAMLKETEDRLTEKKKAYDDLLASINKG